MVAATRRRKGGSRRQRHNDSMSVEGLHASFQKIDGRVRGMITKGRTDSELAGCIRRAWAEQFGTPLSGPAVRGLVSHYRAVAPKARKTRKAQRGGMAPLDWTVGQGTTSAVYGRFPVEMGTTPQVVRGLDLDRFYESPISRGCDSTGGAPAQAGGGLWDTLAQGHPPTSVPANFVQRAITGLQGASTGEASASPVAASVPLASAAPTAFDSSALSSITSMSPVYHSF